MVYDPNKEVEELLNKAIIQLGDKVKDPVTGLVGIATRRTEELGGSPRICVEYPACSEDDGMFGSEVWFPEGRLERIS
jgi:hypothetical protein